MFPELTPILVAVATVGGGLAGLMVACLRGCARRRTTYNHGTWTVAAVLPVFLLLCPQTNAASSDVLTEGLYARVGGGVFVLDLPESSPFIRTNGREEVVGFLDHYDAAFKAGPTVDLAAGGEYEAFGKNLFTELNGFLTFYTSRHVNEYSEDPAPWADVIARFNSQCPADGCPFTPEREQFLVTLTENDPDVRSVGWVGKIDGGAMAFSTPNLGGGDSLRIATKREVDFHGADFITGTFLGQADQARISVFIGPSYKRLTQETGTFAYASGSAPELNNLTLREDLEAWYYGRPPRPSIQGALAFHVRRQATRGVLPGFRIRRVPKNAAELSGRGRENRLENKQFDGCREPRLPSGTEYNVAGKSHLSTADRG